MIGGTNHHHKSLSSLCLPLWAHSLKNRQASLTLQASHISFWRLFHCIRRHHLTLAPLSHDSGHGGSGGRAVGRQGRQVGMPLLSPLYAHAHLSSPLPSSLSHLFTSREWEAGLGWAGGKTGQPTGGGRANRQTGKEQTAPPSLLGQGGWGPHLLPLEAGARWGAASPLLCTPLSPPITSGGRQTWCWCPGHLLSHWAWHFASLHSHTFPLPLCLFCMETVEAVV